MLFSATSEQFGGQRIRPFRLVLCHPSLRLRVSDAAAQSLADGQQDLGCDCKPSTLHLWTADDFLRLRTAIEPALLKSLNSFHGRNIRGLDIPMIVRKARAFHEEAPRTPLEQRSYLSQFAPDRPPETLAYITRTYLPLVQMYPGGVWGTGGSPPYALDIQYLGRAVEAADNLRALIHGYLAAFGPATAADAATWTGLPRLKEAIAGFTRDFVTYRDERGRDLLDLPDMPLPAEDVPVPVRFMPEYDNLLIGHDDRTRVIADAFRKQVFLSAGRVRATFLVDGFVRGAWRGEKGKQAAALVIEPFAPLTPEELSAVLAEGERLLSWVEDKAAGYELRVEPVASA